MRVGDGEVFGFQMQVGKALDDMGLYFPERHIPFHQVGRNAVHQAGEHFGPQGDLQADEQRQNRPGQPQNDIPYDFSCLH